MEAPECRRLRQTREEYGKPKVSWPGWPQMSHLKGLDISELGGAQFMSIVSGWKWVEGPLCELGVLDVCGRSLDTQQAALSIPAALPCSFPTCQQELPTFPSFPHRCSDSPCFSKGTCPWCQNPCHMPCSLNCSPTSSTPRCSPCSSSPLALVPSWAAHFPADHCRQCSDAYHGNGRRITTFPSRYGIAGCTAIIFLCFCRLSCPFFPYPLHPLSSSSTCPCLLSVFHFYVPPPLLILLQRRSPSQPYTRIAMLSLCKILKESASCFGVIPVFKLKDAKILILLVKESEHIMNGHLMEGLGDLIVSYLSILSGDHLSLPGDPPPPPK